MVRYHPAAALEAIEGNGATTFVGVPSMFISMLSALERRGRAFERGALRLCLCGGAPLQPEVQDRWFDATGIELRQGYGLTEASPVVLVNGVARPNVRGTLGAPYPGIDVSIRDPATFSPLADGATGEICVRGETVFSGYVRGAGAPEPRGLEVRDGWLRTGDLCSRRDDGSVVFRGLIKPMFTRNGFNVYPHEIEQAVAELTGVESATVSAIPEVLRENAIALTVSGSVTEPEVRAWCEQRLSAYKQPETITILPASITA
jgi:long-chain acyl-CoA synthetase